MAAIPYEVGGAAIAVTVPSKKPVRKTRSARSAENAGWEAGTSHRGAVHLRADRIKS